VCRCRNAFARALFVIATAITVLVAFPATAAADEPLPRAMPAARAYPRTFTSYEDVMTYATTVAKDQNALDARVAPLRAERDALVANLASGGASTVQGGKLVDPDAQRGGLSSIVAASARIAALTARERQLVDAGALTSPVAPWRIPTAGEMTQAFGPTDLWVEPSRTYDGVTYAHFHEGVDIAGIWAEDVVAPARGRVVFVGMMMDGAEIVVLAHDDGVVTMYAHLDAWNSPPPVRAGDEVAAGQKIGTQGLTGMTTGMHLHWVAWRNGVLIDPLSLLPH
jgi:murein DD-endopeptidase MepM/ murein hydrolase activator NlpD